MDNIIRDGLDMETCSFIIKIWVEQGRSSDDQMIWRGHITHVPSGERRYLKDLDEISTIILLYLKAMGLKFGVGERMKRWLKRQRLSLKV